MRPLNIKKPKVVTAYVVATGEGLMPSVPKKNIKACHKQIPLCQKFKPDAQWRVFEINQIITGIAWNEKTGGKLLVENASPEVEETLGLQLKERHTDVLTAMGMVL